MISIRTALVALAAAFVVRADYYINPDSVPLSTRQNWCQSELSTCPLICQQVPPGTTTDNTCDPTTLTYGCLCGNGQQPNVSEYSLTLPYFVCQEWGVQCQANCGEDNTCAADCVQNHPCGALDPPRASNATSSASTSTAAATSSNQVYSGFGATASATSSTKASYAAITLDIGAAYGLLVVGASLFAGFAVML